MYTLLLVTSALLMINSVLGIICRRRIDKDKRIFDHIRHKLSSCDGLTPHDSAIIKEVLISIENMEIY